ncbi:hypothetical protein AMV026 [Betaentomopoxvirus amoorei]|uniref:AMV026 n=1 Tax=Amsacta moorei entomopoxvirus TaxID=28321 RepID=Q9EN22_AMEPV|nr:hypothetical protein AMV026 [Amsacta moorei entomopoxvirus]AAG02732.1 AMV026 [Amsacta moorei entomopoxvirus]
MCDKINNFQKKLLNNLKLKLYDNVNKIIENKTPLHDLKVILNKNIKKLIIYHNKIYKKYLKIFLERKYKLLMNELIRRIKIEKFIKICYDISSKNINILLNEINIYVANLIYINNII